MELSSQRPIELILARNLLSSLSTPAFLASGPGEIIFYNEAAGAILGQRFEAAAERPVAPHDEFRRAARAGHQGRGPQESVESFFGSQNRERADDGSAVSTQWTRSAGEACEINSISDHHYPVCRDDMRAFQPSSYRVRVDEHRSRRP